MSIRQSSALRETGRVLRDRLLAMGHGPDAGIDLAEAALSLAALSHPGTPLTVYRQHLDALAAPLALPADGGSAADQAAALSARMVGTWHYDGDADTYEDPDNGDLMRVIDRCKGLPVTLGILYLHAARAQGWQADGLAFPGHFLIRLQGAGGDRVIVDPFNGGAIMAVQDLRAMLKAVAGPTSELSPEMYAPVSNRDILVRLQSNVKLRALEAGRIDQALEAIDRLLLITPDDHRLWREAGLLHMRDGDLEGAITALQRYVALAPDSPDRDRIHHVIDELRNRLP